MKKIIFVIGLILILGLVGMPLFNGLAMEKILKQSLGEINRQNADAGLYPFVEIDQYDRNYFSSKIEWKIKLGALKSVYGVDEIIFIENADHGFSKIISTTSLEKNKWFMDFVNKYLEGKNPFDIKTEYKLSGDIESKIVLHAFSFKQGKDLIEIKPGRIHLSYAKNMNNIFSEMVWAGCSIPGKFSVDNIILNSKMKKQNTYIWEGLTSFAVGNIKATGKTKPYEMANLECDYQSNFDISENELSFGMVNSINRIATGQEEIKDIFSKISIKKIDALGYETFIGLYLQMLNNVMAEMKTTQVRPDMVKQLFKEQLASAGFQLLEAIDQLLKKGFEIQVSDVRARLPQGNINGDITLRLIKDMTIAQFIPVFLVPSKALDIIYLKSDLSLPYELLGENQMLFSRIYPQMQTGLFLKEGEKAIHKAETLDGKLLLNGKEVLLH